jgi:riboflavin biosynthesis pyrimidine reductase
MQMVLGPQTGALAVSDLPVSYPWPDRARWLRAMMVTTLDGALAGSDGRSRSISSGGDRQVFSAVRRFADVVLIGANTFRAERYRPMTAKADDASIRAGLGLAPAPVVAILSGSLDLPWEEPIFAESTIRPIVVTTEAADPERLSTAAGHADLLVLPGSDLDLPAMIDRLEQRGLRRILCEGGARLLSTIAQLDLLDEVDLSIAPLMACGGQVVTGSPVALPRRFELAQVVADTDGFLFNRYVRSARP